MRIINLRIWPSNILFKITSWRSEESTANNVAEELGEMGNNWGKKHKRQSKEAKRRDKHCWRASIEDRQCDWSHTFYFHSRFECYITPKHRTMAEGRSLCLSRVFCCSFLLSQWIFIPSSSLSVVIKTILNKSTLEPSRISSVIPSYHLELIHSLERFFSFSLSRFQCGFILWLPF
jgi:hypothetical protein